MKKNLSLIMEKFHFCFFPLFQVLLLLVFILKLIFQFSNQIETFSSHYFQKYKFLWVDYHFYIINFIYLLLPLLIK